MRRQVQVLVTAALVILTATACVGGGTGQTATQTIGPTESRPVPTDASGAPIPVASEPVPVPENATTYPTETSEPSSWGEEALIGACKVAWNEAGQGDGWSDYSSDARIESRPDSFYVAFPSMVGGETRDCSISGTPDSPQVVVAP